MIEGTQIPFTDEALANITDWPRVRKIYKLGAAGGGIVGGSAPNGRQLPGKGGAADEAALKKELAVQILGVMALRGFVN